MRQKEELEILLDEYMKRFGEPYPLVIIDSRIKAVSIIKECLKSGKKAPKPKYKEGAIY